MLESQTMIKTRSTASIFLFLLALIALSPSLYAQTQENKAEQSWYDVEIIIFRHHDYTAAADEAWSTEAIKLKESVELLPMLPENLSEAHSDKLRGPIAFAQLRPEQLLLSEAFERLRDNPNYDPLLHLGWRQPGYEREEAKAVHIHGGINWSSEPREEDENSLGDKKTSNSVDINTFAGTEEQMGPPVPFISGTIKLIRSRFLHLEADLIYRITDANAQTMPEEAKDLPHSFQLKQSRRMRSREYHYLDHPMFGVLVMTTPYELPKEEEELVSPEINGMEEVLKEDSRALNSGKIKR